MDATNYTDLNAKTRSRKGEIKSWRLRAFALKIFTKVHQQMKDKETPVG
jgi:hypothetical protein